MGSVNRVSCECGYTSTVRVGGNRATHNEHSVFPFYCKNCGIVSVNVHGNTTECPYAWCKSKDIHPYGKEPISHGEDRFPSIQWGEYKASRNGNLCPECKNFTLQIGGVEILFD